jgi:hypothetical protein
LKGLPGLRSKVWVFQKAPSFSSGNGSQKEGFFCFVSTQVSIRTVCLQKWNPQRLMRSHDDKDATKQFWEACTAWEGTSASCTVWTTLWTFWMLEATNYSLSPNCGQFLTYKKRCILPAPISIEQYLLFPIESQEFLMKMKKIS